ncbi:MAG: hypothetical protein JWP80_1157 [Pseudomonas sp.]|nr:hypothetical protein [Pseudomonas sp.]
MESAPFIGAQGGLLGLEWLIFEHSVGGVHGDGQLGGFWGG